MSSPSLTRAVWGRLIALPSVAVPLGLGLATSVVAYGLGEMSGFLGFLGLSGVLCGLGIGASHWILSYDRLAAGARAAIRQQEDAGHAKYLADLRQRLDQDDDPRTDRYLATLMRIRDRLRRGTRMDTELESSLVPEIKQSVEELYDLCLRSLERTLLLWHASQEMSTPAAKEKVQAEREKLLSDVEQSIQRLEVSLDHLQTAAIRQDRNQDLTSIREELDGDLEIAKRVEQRMEEIEEHLSIGRRAQARQMESS